FILAFLTAVSESTKDYFSKKALTGEIDEYVSSWALRVFALPLLIIILFFTGIPEIGSKFWIALIVSGGLNVFATILFMKSIQESDLSLVVPMISFTPLFLLVTSPIIVGEFPDMYGLIGVILIVVGTYILNLKEKDKGVFAPIKAIFQKKGPRLILGVAFLWSITSNFDKWGVQASSSYFWVFASTLFISIILFFIMLRYSEDSLNTVKKNTKALVPIGAVNGLKLTFQMAALNFTLVPYVISIKRTSILLSMIVGFFFFRERENISQRLVGGVLMLAGVIFITLL
ncbi:MAG: EamA family transporter, partial [Candidatus Magasanikbacteria bacterium]